MEKLSVSRFHLTSRQTWNLYHSGRQDLSVVYQERRDREKLGCFQPMPPSISYKLLFIPPLFTEHLFHVRPWQGTSEADRNPA